MVDELLNPRRSTATLLLSNVLNRDRRSLDGQWRAIMDPYDSGYVSILGERNRQGYFRDFKPRSSSDRVEYDFDSSMSLSVPGDWNTQRAELLYYEGTVWYRTVITISSAQAASSSGARDLLHFGAANHTTRVFLDGAELATHVGGFGSFAVEVTGLLDAGDHHLVVQVNNRREPDRIPAMRSDWWNFGGITRSVDLVTVPSTFLKDAWVTMDPDGNLVGAVTLDGDEPSDVSLQLADIECNVSIEPASGRGSFKISADRVAHLDRWHPGRPVLHPVVWRCQTDEIHDDVGLRTVAVDGTTILVNDEPVFLRGISIHGEGPSGGRRAHGPSDAATLLGWAEDLGVNFVRLAHYQHDEHMIREAERRGLLVWTELPVYWGIAFDDEAVLANAQAQADELVVRDRSRAAVVLWSIANETLPGADRTAFLASLIEHVRSLDSSRLITAALLTVPSNDPVVHVDDELGALVDVIAINQYLGWYYGDRSLLPDIRFSTAFNKPIVFSELGAGAKAGEHGTDDQIWTEEFQAAVYEAQIAMIRKQPDCAGLSPWILKDFRTPLRVLPRVQDGYNRKGLVSEEGTPKLAFGVLQEFYATLQADADVSKTSLADKSVLE